MYKSFILILAIIGLTACSKEAAPPDTPATVESQLREIQWFDGSVEQAFDKAKASNKPLFLYWGAEWCPPCNQLKYTIFKDPDFIAITDQFVSVYLDGDTERAQVYGDKYRTVGYPSLLIFNPDGDELTRIPGSMAASQYPEVFSLALEQVRPMKAVVALLNEAPANLQERDFKLLAHYSWWQDQASVLPEKSPQDLLWQAYTQCPETLAIEKSKLLLYSLHFTIEYADENVAIGEVFAESEKPQLREALREVLQHPELSLANVYPLRYEDGVLIQALSDANSQAREQLLEDWAQALSKLREDKRLSTMEVLGTWYAETSLERLQYQNLRPEFIRRVENAVQQARSSIANPYEHSAVINMMRNLLNHAEMQALSESIIREEIAKASSPYYFMLDLAQYDQSQERFDSALSWLRKAYEEAPVGATKLQWAYNYLAGLVEMKPEDAVQIEKQLNAIVAIIESDEGAFFNRSRTRLNRMQKLLLTWAEAHQGQTVLDQFKQQIELICQKATNKTNCQAYLDQFALVGEA